MKICLLGSAGFFPSNSKETSSVLIIDKTTGLLFDAGTGIRRLLEPEIQEQLKGINQLHIFFSHLHHDHTSGFTWLLRLWQKKAKIYVPSRPLVDFDGGSALDILTSPPFFALPIQKWKNISEIVLIDGRDIKIDHLSVKVISQKHGGGGSLGYRINKFAYITDTEPRHEHVNFINGCDLVLIDTMHDVNDFEKQNSTEINPAHHGCSLGNALVAKQANISRLGLIHIDPLYDQDQISQLLLEAQSVFPNAFIPQEGVVYNVSD